MHVKSISAALSPDPHSLYYSHVINLLLLTSTIEGIIENSHYVLIKNLNAFLNFKNKTIHLYYCPYCLIAKTTTEAIQRHLDYCSNQDPQKVEYPTRDKEGNRPILQFNNNH